MPVGYHQDLRQAPWVLLVGSWTNIILYTVELLFIIYFLSNCSFRASKVYLGLTLSLDTICTAAVCGHVYYFVTGTSTSEPHAAFPSSYPLLSIAILLTCLSGMFNQIIGITVNPRQWTTPLVMVPTFLAGAMEQAFLVFRYRTLSGRRRLSAVLWGITVRVHTVFSILGPTHAIYTQSGWKPANFAIIIASTLSCATDLLIAGLMVRTLQTAPIIYDSTRSLLRRISILAVMCGCTSALATLLMLISFFFNFDAYTFILFCLGRIYTLTVLSNISLLQRISIRLGLGLVSVEEP
ncbi:hypothetical protein K435DRAFT_528218 [Dendrothele bispora CBS 962.96]|uniref:DUF6534 domain-containing protein n=1 Tax=Dendrothele bispora (strain CBS 962.96) TaxID=1314807 RepID=A0A4S8KUF2_DENBC|nr:hypothetical protein K435DRAFT_528218 [Dendrothele bispora CBS 962.96]